MIHKIDSKYDCNNVHGNLWMCVFDNVNINIWDIILINVFDNVQYNIGNYARRNTK